MNKQNRNKDEMVANVSAFGESEKDSFSDVPAIATTFADIKMCHREIELNDSIFKEGVKGIVVSKDVSQGELIKTGLVVAGGLYAYAVDNNDSELMTLADLNTKSFGKLRDSEIPVMVERIIDKADLLKDKLANYGITEAKLTESRTKLNDYITKFGSVSTGKGAKSAANSTIKLLLEKCDKKLKVLDKLMLAYKETNPVLYNKYLAARTIYNKGTTHKTNGETETAEAATTPSA